MAKKNKAIPIGFDYVNQTLPWATEKAWRLLTLQQALLNIYAFPSQPEGTKGDSLYTTTTPPKDSVLDLAKCLGMEGYGYNYDIFWTPTKTSLPVKYMYIYVQLYDAIMLISPMYNPHNIYNICMINK